MSLESTPSQWSEARRRRPAVRNSSLAVAPEFSGPIERFGVRDHATALSARVWRLRLRALDGGREVADDDARSQTGRTAASSGGSPP
jgi:hypothetical protein